ncbi:MAG: SEC-C metal-binding domain-containing protein [Planctomycetota bacterium]
MASLPPEEKGSIGKVVKMELKNFLSSSFARELENKHKTHLESIAHKFLDTVYIHHNTTPKEMDSKEFSDIVLNTLPRRFDGDEDYLPSVPVVVSAYIDYLKDSKGVSDPDGFDAVLKDLKQKFTKTAKKIDDNDRIRVDEKGVQIKRDDSKVGRNDPCPCGSGKKYKKCCQAKENAL